MDRRLPRRRCRAERTARGLVVGFVSAAAAGRPSILVDGFDSRYFMYMEDVDLGDRLGKAGWLNVYVPSAVIVHARGHSAGKNPELMLPAHHRSAYRFQADRNPGVLRAPLRLALRAGLALRSSGVQAARRALDRESYLTGDER